MFDMFQLVIIRMTKPIILRRILKRTVSHTVFLWWHNRVGGDLTKVWGSWRPQYRTEQLSASYEYSWQVFLLIFCIQNKFLSIVSDNKSPTMFVTNPVIWFNEKRKMFHLWELKKFDVGSVWKILFDSIADNFGLSSITYKVSCSWSLGSRWLTPPVRLVGITEMWYVRFVATLE